jgi:hypothetical protein
MAAVRSPTGLILNSGGWIERPYELSQCCRTDWYVRDYGTLPGIDLNWRIGGTSIWPITLVRRPEHDVVLLGPRGRVRLWRP